MKALNILKTAITTSYSISKNYIIFLYLWIFFTGSSLAINSAQTEGPIEIFTATMELPTVIAHFEIWKTLRDLGFGLLTIGIILYIILMVVLIVAYKEKAETLVKQLVKLVLLFALNLFSYPIVMTILETILRVSSR